MNPEKGQISINTENILPIIKKWLYSEKEIFIRELVSNAVDAIHKLEKLNILGDVKTAVDEPRIDIEVDSTAKTITIKDSGLGMTGEEIKRYITQVAFSGLQDFVEKYKGKADEEQIIGHFGLGFYSSFMVSSKVTIDTLSYQEGAEAAFWECLGDTEFSLSAGSRTKIGSTITLHISEEEKEILDGSRVEEMVRKYCSFMKYPVYVNQTQINETRPAWTKSPSELKDEDYTAFFSSVFPMASQPLFWIHLNVDYPFKLRGILFFPKITHELEASQGQVKLYCNQVFVEDSCKELIPEYLTLLKGVIDSPDIPLNVSRSALQKDSKVHMLGKHITKKVCDKLSGLFKTDRQAYEKYWADIHPFVKYAMMREPEFYEKMKDFLIFKLAGEEKFVTLDEYLERNKDKSEGKIFYCTDLSLQAGYVQLLRSNNIDAIVTESMIDKHFIPYFEMLSRNKYPFVRVDAEISKHLIETAAPSIIIDPTDNKTSTQKIEDIFKKYLNQEKIEIRVEALKSATLPSMLICDENKRRLQEMQKMGQFPMMTMDKFENKQTLLVNQNAAAIKNLLSLAKSFNRDEEIKLLVDQVYDLALLQQGELDSNSMQSFVERSSAVLAKLGNQPQMSSELSK